VAKTKGSFTLRHAISSLMLATFPTRIISTKLSQILFRQLNHQLTSQMTLDPVIWPGPAETGIGVDFASRGYVLLDRLVRPDFAADLCRRLDRVLADGSGDIGEPDKAPPENDGKRHSLTSTPSKRTLQVINIWKADSAFRSLVTSPKLGEAVADLAGWSKGARVINDQVWAKPPGSSPLTFHRDSAYFDFDPDDILTVWIALDDMRNVGVGPLQYVEGSHLWNDQWSGGTEGFFNKNHRWMCLQALKRHLQAEGDTEEKDTAEMLSSKTVTVAVPIGGAGIHDGRLWHGSDRNNSSGPRRGLGIHFAPAQATFNNTQGNTLAHKIARKQSTQVIDTQLDPDIFPITFQR